MVLINETECNGIIRRINRERAIILVIILDSIDHKCLFDVDHSFLYIYIEGQSMRFKKFVVLYGLL